MKKVKKILSCMLAITIMATQLMPTFSLASTDVTENHKKDLVLWYDEPAESWMRQALPIGNGYMGAMVFGGVTEETVQFNEKTLWTGGPGSEGYEFGITDTVKEQAYNQLMAVRDKLLQDGVLYVDRNPTLIDAGFYANNVGFGNYQNFGQLDFKFDDSLGSYSEYKRFLDLRTALSGVRFVSGGITYEREYFANYPENVIAMKLGASQQGSISFNLGVTSAQGGTATASVNDGVGAIALAGTVADNGLKYESAVRVVADGGTVSAKDGRVYVESANEVTVYLSAGTDYKNEYPTYRGEDPHDAVISRIERAVTLGYDALKESHLNDYQELFSRVELDLDHDPENDVTTDEQLKAYFEGKYDSRALEVMLFQYGRYLLISSSREGSLPANLQGVWNDSNTPPWTGDYHFNINVQMNYWPAYVTNISETALNYIDYVDSLRESGRVTAQTLLGIKSDEQNPENGWMVNTMNNPFGYTMPYGSWGWTPASNAWVSSSFWEYYEFTQDKEYLENTIYPIIREAAVFWTQALDEKDGRLVSVPSISPENGAFTAGCTYDQELIWQLYTDVIEASTLLDCDKELRETLIAQREKLDPLHVSERGTLKEWYYEDEDGFYDRDLHHRHISHLVGVYPGKHITADTPLYADAAKATLDERGDGGTGWSRAHKISLWARLGDGNHAYKLIQSQLTRSTDETISYSTGGTYDNLLCACSPFMFDGSAGATAGIAEMLIQSHDGSITPLAAIPDTWDSGSYSGLVARGNFEVSAKWQDGMLSDFSVLSGSGNECVVAYDAIGAATVTCDGKAVAFTVSDGGNTIAFDTEAGKQYDIKLPVSPTDVTAIRKTTDRVDISWSKTEGAENYNVYRSENGKIKDKYFTFNN